MLEILENNIDKITEQENVRKMLQNNLDKITEQANMELASVFSDLAEKIKPEAQALAKQLNIPFNDAFVQAFEEHLDKNFLDDIEALKKQKNLSMDAATRIIMERNGHLNLMAEKQLLESLPDKPLS